MKEKTKYALENLAPYIRVLVQPADKIIKIIPLFWDRRKIVVGIDRGCSNLPRDRGFVTVWVAISKTYSTSFLARIRVFFDGASIPKQSDYFSTL
jgi:hypothetical protein